MFGIDPSNPGRKKLPTRTTFAFVVLPLLLVVTGCGGEVEDDTPPTASINYTCDEYVCIFEATGQNGDIDGNLGYFWSFAGGTGASGQRVRHFFRVSGDRNVTLTVIDRAGNSSQTTETVSITVPTMAAYTSLARSTFGMLIYIADNLASLDPQLADLTTTVEDNVIGSTLPVDFQCGTTGTGTLDIFLDENSDNLIGADDSATYHLDGCGYGATFSPITAAEPGLVVTGDPRSGTYALRNTFDNVGITAIDNSNYRLLLNIDIEEQASAGEFLISGNQFGGLRFNDAGTPVAEISMREPDLLVSTDLSGFVGEAVLTSSEFVSNWTVRITDPLEFSEASGELRLISGTVDLFLDDGSFLRLYPDADPAFVYAEFYRIDSTSPSAQGPLPQRFVVERLQEF